MPNSEANQQMTLAFVAQLKLRPINVVCNLNTLLEGSGVRLSLVDPNPCRSREEEASLFDALRSPQEQIATEEYAREKSCFVPVEENHESGTD